MGTDMKFGKWCGAFFLLLLSMPMLVACAKSSVPVSIHGVNYSANTFSYVLVDPANSENRGGGELVGAYSAGGTVCCYALPAKWRPGIKIEVREIYWLPKLPDDSLPEVTKKHVVELPPYATGKAGELWVVRAADGSMAVVSSNYQPDHVSWPGKIKGWPIPSLQYQRERWDLHINQAQHDVELYISSLDELKKKPIEHAKESWAVSAQHGPEELKGYSGPDDVAYLLMLRQSYESALVDVRAKLQRMKDSRP